MYGLIPAAGKGERFLSPGVSKCLLEVGGQRLLERNICLLRDQLGIQEIVIVIGHLGDEVVSAIGSGKELGVDITYVRNEYLDRGLAYSIRLGRKPLDEPCCVVLGDEFYAATNHRGLLSPAYQGAAVTCGILDGYDEGAIRQNYSVVVEGDRIIRLTEKPTLVESALLGTGTFLLSPEAFARLDAALATPGSLDFVTFVDSLCQKNVVIKAFNLEGVYFNINDVVSLARAREYCNTSI